MNILIVLFLLLSWRFCKWLWSPSLSHSLCLVDRSSKYGAAVPLIVCGDPLPSWTLLLGRLTNWSRIWLNFRLNLLTFFSCRVATRTKKWRQKKLFCHSVHAPGESIEGNHSLWRNFFPKSLKNGGLRVILVILQDFSCRPHFLTFSKNFFNSVYYFYTLIHPGGC